MWLVIRESYDGERDYIDPMSVWATREGAETEANRLGPRKPSSVNWTHYEVQEIDFEPTE